MCELFGLSSNRPVQPGELLHRFGARGGNTADNPDADLPRNKSIMSATGRSAPLKNGGSP